MCWLLSFLLSKGAPRVQEEVREGNEGCFPLNIALLAFLQGYGSSSAIINHHELVVTWVNVHRHRCLWPILPLRIWLHCQDIPSWSFWWTHIGPHGLDLQQRNGRMQREPLQVSVSQKKLNMSRTHRFCHLLLCTRRFPLFNGRFFVPVDAGDVALLLPFDFITNWVKVGFLVNHIAFANLLFGHSRFATWVK